MCLKKIYSHVMYLSVYSKKCSLEFANNCAFVFTPDALFSGHLDSPKRLSLTYSWFNNVQ